MAAIEYQGITKKYPGNDYLSVDHVNAVIEEGEFVTILGSSGCGKTTLLKMTNSLIRPTEGKVLFFGKDTAEEDPVQVRRKMGYVIQQIGLFPHMTIEDNIAAIPKTLKWDKDRIDKRVDELMNLVDLDPKVYRKRYPSQLSGGQQQRIGLARALVTDPAVMLLDEPFGAIDAITRINLQNELKRIHKESGKTFLLVTHDINEAFQLGTKVMIMNHGKLLQFDTPKNIIHHPADSFVSELIDSQKEQEEFWKEAEQ